MVTVVVLRTPRLKPRREHREKAAYFLLPFFFLTSCRRRKKIIFSKRNLWIQSPALSAYSILLSCLFCLPGGCLLVSPGLGRCALIVPVMWTLSPLWMFHEIARDVEDVASIREELCRALRVEEGPLDAEK